MSTLAVLDTPPQETETQEIKVGDICWVYGNRTTEDRPPSIWAVTVKSVAGLVSTVVDSAGVSDVFPQAKLFQTKDAATRAAIEHLLGLVNQLEKSL